MTKELAFLRRLLYSETASAALPRTEDWYHRMCEYSTSCPLKSEQSDYPIKSYIGFELSFFSTNLTYASIFVQGSLKNT